MDNNKNAINIQNKYVRVEAVAEYTGLSTSTLYRWAENNIIPSYKIGGRARLFKLSEVEECIKSFNGTTVVKKGVVA
jgi:excisionase family DNA binding protein